jgi:hypothetical protein
MNSPAPPPTWLGSALLAHLALRMRMEKQLLWRRWKPLLLTSFMLVYFALIVFRNLAFYRFRPDEMLQDLGHDWLPEVSERASGWVDAPMYAVISLLVFCILGSLVPSSGAPAAKRKPLVVNVVVRFLVVYAVGHTLRAATYLSTALTGTARHCRPGADLSGRPATVGQCFTHMVSVNGNCGDLNFSGHVMLMMLGLGLIDSYGHCMWGWGYHCGRHWALLLLGAALAAGQVLLIVAARHHYSVDVVVALYTTPMLWYAMRDVTLDLDPDLEEIARDVQREAGWPVWRQVLHHASTIALALFITSCLWATMKGNLKGLFA